MQLYKLFPANVIDDVDQFIISTWSHFDTKNFFPFIPIKRPFDYLNDNSVYYAGLLEDVPLLEKVCERLIREAIHAPSLLRKKYTPDGKLSSTMLPPNWREIDQKLLKQLHLGHKYTQMMMTKLGKCRKGNADIRLSSNWNDLYAVKSLFTFGLRCPDENECHVLTTTSCPILYYIPKSNARLKVNGYFKEGVFAPHHQVDFECHILEPHSTFIIPPKTQYLIITIQQTVFSLIRCTSRVLKELEEQQNPKFTSLKFKMSKVFVPSQPSQSIPAPQIWNPNVHVTDGVPHEDEWALETILPTRIEIVAASSTSTQNTSTPNTSEPSKDTNQSAHFNVSLDTSALTQEQFQIEVQRLMTEHLKMYNH